MLGRWHQTNIRNLKEAIKEARASADEEARGQHPWVRSRGTFLATLDFARNQCRPFVEAEAVFWRGTWKEITDAVRLVIDQHPNVAEVYIAGGYDGAESYNALWVDDNYEPWVSSWNVTVWTRDKPVEKPDAKSEGDAVPEPRRLEARGAA